MGVAEGVRSVLLRTAQVVVIMLLALVAGCGSLLPPFGPSLGSPAVGGPAAEGRRPESTPSGTPTTAPRVLAAVYLTNLPIGGRSRYTDDTQDLQCVAVHWAIKPTSKAALPRGVTVRVTTVAVDRQVFRLATRGCSSTGPSCLGHTFTATNGSRACSLALRTRRPVTTTLDDRRLSMGGLLTCPESVGVAACQASAVAIVDHWKTIAVSTPQQQTPARG